MADTLRSKMIRLAASMPKGSSERTALLNVLAARRVQVQSVQGEDRLVMDGTHVATLTRQGRIFVLRERGGVKGEWREVGYNETGYDQIMAAFQGEEAPDWLLDRLVRPARTATLSEDEVKKRLYDATVAFEEARNRQNREKQRGYGGPWAKGHHLGVEVKRLQQEVWQYERMLGRMGVPFKPHVPGARVERL